MQGLRSTGTGAFALVKAAANTDTGMPVAVKIVKFNPEVAKAAGAVVGASSGQNGKVGLVLPTHDANLPSSSREGALIPFRKPAACLCRCPAAPTATASTAPAKRTTPPRAAPPEQPLAPFS